MKTVILENLEAASPAELLELFDYLAETTGLDKALRTPAGDEFGEDFEDWFLNELSRRARLRFASARVHIWRVIEDYLRQRGGVFARLSDEQIADLQQAIFDLGMAHTSRMVGISVDPAVARRLQRWRWTAEEVQDFPGLAYRFGLIRDLIEKRQIQDFPTLVRMAQAHPMTEPERQAVKVARQSALSQLTPVFSAAGKLLVGAALKREREALQRQVVGGLARRQHPFALARDMFAMEGDTNFRDFERIARTEMANSFSWGSWQADRTSGKFGNGDYVYRITRANGCKICLALFTNPDGTPRLYNVKDLENETTPKIDVGIRVKRFFQAGIGQPHPNCLCGPWNKYYKGISDSNFKEFAPNYVEGRKRFHLETAEAA